ISARLVGSGVGMGVDMGVTPPVTPLENSPIPKKSVDGTVKRTRFSKAACVPSAREWVKGISMLGSSEPSCALMQQSPSLSPFNNVMGLGIPPGPAPDLVNVMLTCGNTPGGASVSIVNEPVIISRKTSGALQGGPKQAIVPGSNSYVINAAE